MQLLSLRNEIKEHALQSRQQKSQGRPLQFFSLRLLRLCDVHKIIFEKACPHSRRGEAVPVRLRFLQLRWKMRGKPEIAFQENAQY